MNKTVKLGQVVVTNGVAATFPFDSDGGEDWAHFLSLCTFRHQQGDWGELDDEDWQANREALETGNRILSSYPIPSVFSKDAADEKLWVITEADRSVTTILYPSEY